MHPGMASRADRNQQRSMVETWLAVVYPRPAPGATNPAAPIISFQNLLALASEEPDGVPGLPVTRPTEPRGERRHGTAGAEERSLPGTVTRVPFPQAEKLSNLSTPLRVSGQNKRVRWDLADLSSLKMHT